MLWWPLPKLRGSGRVVVQGQVAENSRLTLSLEMEGRNEVVVVEVAVQLEMERWQKVVGLKVS